MSAPAHLEYEWSSEDFPQERFLYWLLAWNREWFYQWWGDQRLRD